MPETRFLRQRLTTVVFDVDGTLYRQSPLRRAMLIRLVTAHLLSPLRGWRTMLALGAYRHAQEELRGRPPHDVASAQIRLACERTDLEASYLTTCVERWMEREPLALLPQCMQPGLVDFLGACRARGLRLGALSDYPVEEKLRALGVARFFEVALCAQSAEIGVFKPDARGLRVVLERLGSTAAETLYIGDREDVDAPTARAAGVACAIISRRTPTRPVDHLNVRSYAELGRHLFAGDATDDSSPDFTQVA